MQYRMRENKSTECVAFTHPAQAKLARLKQRDKKNACYTGYLFWSPQFLKLQGIGRDVHYKTTIAQSSLSYVRTAQAQLEDV